MRRLEEEGDIAADYLEELLDIGDLDGDIDIDVDGDRASVEISGADQLARLNRPKGELLGALQELARLAVQTRTGNRSRLMLDIGGFRAEHKDGLEKLAAEAVADARAEEIGRASCRERGGGGGGGGGGQEKQQSRGREAGSEG